MSFYTNVAQYKTKIYARGYDNGRPFNRRESFAPTLYVESDKPSEWKSHLGVQLSPIEFESIVEARDFVEEYAEVDNFRIYGQTHYTHGYISEKWPEEVMEWSLDQIRVTTLDIEVKSENGFPNAQQANEEVTAITVMDRTTKEIVSFGCGEYIPHHDNIRYVKCATERELLQAFLSHWSANYPDIVTGWYVKYFDIPYLVNRLARVFGDETAKKLGMWYVKQRETEKFGQKRSFFELGGISILDYQELYRKFTYNMQESYTLEHICQVELGEGKLSYEEHETLHLLYRNDFQKYMEYNNRDVWLVYRLEKKLRMIELCATMAYDAKINYEEVYSQTRFWDALIYNHLLRKKIALPPRPAGMKAESYSGGYVKNPRVGAYKWVVSFDATSLYPSLILQYNISPDTIADRETDVNVDVDDLIDHKVAIEKSNVGLAANGVHFSNDKLGFFPELVDKFFKDRQVFKKKYLDSKKLFEETHDPKYQDEMSRYNVYQMARKISLNSLYGAAGSPYFRFFSIRIAEAITLSGQMMIQVMENTVNNYLNKLLKNETPKPYVIACDTDSVYITLDDLVTKVLGENADTDKVVNFLDKVCKEKLTPVLDAACEGIATYTNAYRNAISFKRESISDYGFWTAKKRYALRVYDNEGVRYQEPEIKVTGLEVVRSSTPAVVRTMLRGAIKVIMDGKESALWDYVSEKQAEFNACRPEDISFPRSISGLEKYGSTSSIYEKGTPMQVRAALMYNHLLKKHKLEKKYRPILEGDKIKFVYLKEPNTIRENTIAFPSSLPKEFGIHSYIDYEVMFNKTFLEPLASILSCIGWTHSRVNTIDDLFA